VGELSNVTAIVGLLGGLAGLLGLVFAVGRWAGGKDKGAEQISAEQAKARDDTRFSVKRIEEQVVATAAENKAAFATVNEAMRPLFEWHATRAQLERDIQELRQDNRAHRERLIRIETMLGVADDEPRASQPRARTRTPGHGVPRKDE
jgi:hypothetical protein